MSDNEKNMMNEENEEQEPDTVIFEDEDGNEYAFTPIDYFFYNGEEYCLLTELTDEDEDDEEGVEVIVCKMGTETNEDGEEEEVYDIVEDEALAAKLVEIANTKMNEDEEE